MVKSASLSDQFIRLAFQSSGITGFASRIYSLVIVLPLPASAWSNIFCCSSLFLPSLPLSFSLPFPPPRIPLSQDPFLFFLRKYQASRCHRLVLYNQMRPLTEDYCLLLRAPRVNEHAWLLDFVPRLVKKRQPRFVDETRATT